MNDRRFTFKLLGVLMESVNNSPDEFRKTLWHIAAVLAVLIITWRLPDLLTAFDQIMS